MVTFFIPWIYFMSIISVVPFLVSYNGMKVWPQSWIHMSHTYIVLQVLISLTAILSDKTLIHIQLPLMTHLIKLRVGYLIFFGMIFLDLNERSILAYLGTVHLVGLYHGALSSNFYTHLTAEVQFWLRKSNPRLTAIGHC